MKYKTKNMVKIICAFLAGALLLGVFLYLGGNNLQTSFFEKKLNEDNLIKVDDYVIEDEKTEIGLEIDVDENTGVIKFSGKATADYTFVVSQVELEAGTYTISGYDDSTKGKCYLAVLYDVDQIAMCGAKTKTFTLEQAETVTVQIVVSKDASFNVFTPSTFEPCLVKGEIEGTFFVK